MLATATTELVAAPTPEEQRDLERLRDLLRDEPGRLTLSTERGSTLVLPFAVIELLRGGLSALAEGSVIQLTVMTKDLTEWQAANLLNETVGFVRHLLDEGAMPSYEMRGARRIHLDDLLAYKRQRDAVRREGLAELTRMSQELGLYDVPESSNGLAAASE